MRINRLILSLLAVGVCCLGQDVRYNFAAGQDFSKYHTYKWVQISGTEKVNQLAEQQLQAAVDAEMTKKGLKRTDGDNADLLIGYQAAIGQEKEYTSFNSGWGTGPGWYGGGWYGAYGGMGSTTSGQTSTIYVGQIGLDMYDPAQKQLVWRGNASKTLDTKAKPDKQKKNLEKAMAKLLKNFPPPPQEELDKADAWPLNPAACTLSMRYGATQHAMGEYACNGECTPVSGRISCRVSLHASLSLYP